MTKPEIRVAAPAVARAIKLVEALVNQPKSLSSLSKRLRVPKSSLHGISTTLIGCGWIVVDDMGRLALGDRLFQMGVLYGRRYQLIASFRESARQAVEATGETTFLGVLSGSEVEHLARVDGTQAVRLIVREGDRVPAHATALGKAILAGRPAGSLAEIFGAEPLPRLTPLTVTQMADFETQLDEIRDRGYVVELGEVDENLHCVAAPVRDATGTTIASVAIAAPAFRAATRMPHYISTVLGLAQEVSRQLGYREGGAATVPGRPARGRKSRPGKPAPGGGRTASRRTRATATGAEEA